MTKQKKTKKGKPLPGPKKAGRSNADETQVKKWLESLKEQ